MSRSACSRAYPNTRWNTSVTQLMRFTGSLWTITFHGGAVRSHSRVSTLGAAAVDAPRLVGASQMLHLEKSIWSPDITNLPKHLAARADASWMPCACHC